MVPTFLCPCFLQHVAQVHNAVFYPDSPHYLKRLPVPKLVDHAVSPTKFPYAPEKTSVKEDTFITLAHVAAAQDIYLEQDYKKVEDEKRDSGQ